ncbi:MAG: YIEGIA domain-containing protein, partial [Limnochordia bacterium]
MRYLTTIVLATFSGLMARLYMLRRDYRQYPSYPQGWAIHLFIGFIGAL